MFSYTHFVYNIYKLGNSTVTQEWFILGPLWELDISQIRPNVENYKDLVLPISVPYTLKILQLKEYRLHTMFQPQYSECHKRWY